MHSSSLIVRAIIIVLASLTCIVAKPTLAQSPKPNLSGTWELNLSESKLSRGHRAVHDRYKIRHLEPQLIVEYTDSSISETSRYTTDGKLRPPDPQHLEELAKAYWDGDTLVIEKHHEIYQDRITWIGRYTLSQDGQSLAVAKHVTRNSFSIDLDESLVYDKQK
jgi:hypothetical protein